LKVFQD